MLDVVLQKLTLKQNNSQGGTNPTVAIFLSPKNPFMFLAKIQEPWAFATTRVKSALQLPRLPLHFHPQVSSFLPQLVASSLLSTASLIVQLPYH